MADAHEYRFRIDAWTPETIPMARLADYMRDVATLLGETEHVHFVRVDPGSALLVQSVEHESLHNVQARLRADFAQGEGEAEALRAYRNIDKRLAEDNASGALFEPDGAEVIRFPGRETPQPLTFGAFTQPGTLDGVLIRIGGKDDSVPVWLQQDEALYKCTATREMACRLAPQLFKAELRVQGSGRWERNAEGAWHLKKFSISAFEVLDDTPLPAVVERLRQVPGSGWKETQDPYAVLRGLRGDAERWSG
ncbi:hypothetical protein [Thiohalocapsa halophila]|nr:hypothetical protein [Thiohalocapsa halophila]